MNNLFETRYEQKGEVTLKNICDYNEGWRTVVLYKGEAISVGYSRKDRNENIKNAIAAIESYVNKDSLYELIKTRVDNLEIYDYDNFSVKSLLQSLILENSILEY